MNALFDVSGRPVMRGDVLFHRDIHLTGGRVIAEFKPEGEYVTVRSTPSGAVPTVRVADLSWAPHPDDVLRDLFNEQARGNGVRRTTERDFKMWLLGRAAPH